MKIHHKWGHRVSSEPTSEQIHISEIDETGAAVQNAEAEYEPDDGGRFNPWLIALWVLCAVSVGLFVLALLGGAFSYPSGYSAGFPNEPSLERPWYAVLAPFSWLFLIMSFLSLLSVLLLQAVFWERRKSRTLLG